MIEMPFEECFQVLELRPSAGPRSVKRAFRRLAKRHHPDLQRSPSAAVDFARIVQAYTTLQRAFRVQSGESDARLCATCGRLAELFEGLDGGVYCSDCLLGVSRRRLLLPSPPIRRATHRLVILLELLAVALFVHGLVLGARGSLTASMAVSIGALVLLAVTCAVVRHVR